MRRDEWDRRYAETELLWTGSPNRFLVAEVADLPPGRALDLASGEGRSAVWLAQQGWRVTAVDFSTVATERARQWAEKEGLDLDVVCADLLEFEPEPEAYDLVVVLYLHLPRDELRPVLSRASRALAPGGTLLLVGHDLTNIAEGVGGPQYPEVLYTPADIVEALPELEVDKAERVRRDVEGEDRPAIDALVRAHRPGRAEA
jgi:SAM-dependent methyltransferase